MKIDGITHGEYWAAGHTEFGASAKSKGYTARGNLNPGYVRMVREGLKETGVEIAKCYKNGHVKRAVSLMQGAVRQKVYLMERFNRSDKLIYDADGNTLFWWDFGSDHFDRVE